MSDPANEEDEAFSDAVSQIKPTTVTSSHLWVLNYKSEVKLNVLCVACSLSFSSTSHILRPFCVHVFAFVCDSDYTCMYVCTSVHSESAGFQFARLPFIPFGEHHIESICSFSVCLVRPLHTVLLTDFQLELTIWAAINRSMLLSGWIVILRWRWQCFAFEFPKHNYICSRELHACCCCWCHYTTIVVTTVATAATSAASAAVIIIIIVFSVVAHIVFRCVFLSRNKQLLN